jgi:multicomponent K+:H+ antiporter subunit G
MSHAVGLPLFVALVVAILALGGAVLALIGSIGLLRLKTFYERVHPATMGTTLGVGLNLIASMVLFTVLESRPVLHELLITVFMIVTTPVTFTLLVRAATHREQVGETALHREQPADESHS